MQLSDLELLVGQLTNDPSQTRYAKTDVDTELDNTQTQWNAEIKIIKETTSQTLTAGMRQYDLTTLPGWFLTAPIAFPRATHKGLKLTKRSKSYFDLYSKGYDWTQAIGTPTDFIIEATDSSNLYLTVYPTPQSGDVDAPVVVEAIMAHTPMSAATDVPFLYGVVSNYLLRPYDFYLAYSAAARLLARDPSPENQARAGQYLVIAGQGKDLLINVFKQLEADEPLRMSGGRQW
jgi:hypothetical protein